MATSKSKAPDTRRYHKDFENKTRVSVGWGGIWQFSVLST